MIVVKVGGAEGINYEAVAKDAASLWKEGVKLLLVHGGAPRPTRWRRPWATRPASSPTPGGR